MRWPRGFYPLQMQFLPYCIQNTLTDPIWRVIKKTQTWVDQMMGKNNNKVKIRLKWEVQIQRRCSRPSEYWLIFVASALTERAQTLKILASSSPFLNYKDYSLKTPLSRDFQVNHKRTKSHGTIPSASALTHTKKSRPKKAPKTPNTWRSFQAYQLKPHFTCTPPYPSTSDFQRKPTWQRAPYPTFHNSTAWPSWSARTQIPLSMNTTKLRACFERTFTKPNKTNTHHKEL